MSKQAMYEVYGNERPQGTMCITNVFGVYYYELIGEDRYSNKDCILAWCNMDNIYGFRKHKIFYTSSGRAYCRKGSMRLYLDEFMRV